VLSSLKVLKITCVDGKDCHAYCLSLDPSCVSVWHKPNNHITFSADDYDIDGHVKKSSVLDNHIKELDVTVRSEFMQILNKEFV
jgi:hypothetical protein